MAGVDQDDSVGKARQQIPANPGIGGQFRSNAGSATSKTEALTCNSGPSGCNNGRRESRISFVAIMRAALSPQERKNARYSFDPRHVGKGSFGQLWSASCFWCFCLIS